MKFIYGTEEKNIDITDLVMKKFLVNGEINIPANDDLRANLFSDPAFGMLKRIVVYDSNNNIKKYDYSQRIKLKENALFVDTSSISPRDYFNNYSKFNLDNSGKLNLVHNLLKEDCSSSSSSSSCKKDNSLQLVLVKHLGETSNVLLLDSGVINSLVIATLVGKLTVFVEEEYIFNRIKRSKEVNNFNFNLEMGSAEKCSEYDVLVVNSSSSCCKDKLSSLINSGNFKLVILKNEFKSIEDKDNTSRMLEENKFKVECQEDGLYEIWLK